MSSLTFFQLLRAHDHSITPFQLAAERGESIEEATNALHAYASAIRGSKLLMTATTLTQRAAQIQRIEQKQRAKGMSLRKKSTATDAMIEAMESNSPKTKIPGGLHSMPAASTVPLQPLAPPPPLRESVIHECVFVFPPNSELLYLSSSFRAKLGWVCSRWMAPWLFWGAQVLFGVSLLLSILAVLTAIVILIILMMSKEGNGGGGGVGGGAWWPGGGGGGGGGGGSSAPLPTAPPVVPHSYHYHYNNDGYWFFRLWLDLTHPPLYYRGYENEMAYREAAPFGPAAAASSSSASASSSSSAASKPNPPMPGDDDSSSSSSGVGSSGVPNRLSDLPRLPPRPNPDNDPEDDDPESGLSLGLGAGEAGGAGGTGAGAGGETEVMELGFFASIFSFVFGNGSPKCKVSGSSGSGSNSGSGVGVPFNTVMWTALANRIRANGGTVLAEECKPFVFDATVVKGAEKRTVAEELAANFPPEPAAAPASASASSASAQPHVPRADADLEIDEHGPLLPRAPASRVDPNAAYMLPILMHFRGHAVSSPDGRVIAYQFPMLAAQYHRLRESGQLHDASVAPRYSFVREPMWLMSHCSSSQVGWAIGLGLFNLALVLFFPLMLRWADREDFASQSSEEVEAKMKIKEEALNLGLQFSWWLLHTLQKLYPLMLTYALGFFLIPLGRWIVIRYWINKRIAQRNAKRRGWSLAINLHAPEAFLRDMAVARSIGLNDRRFGAVNPAASSSASSASSSSSSSAAPSFLVAPDSAIGVSSQVVYESVSSRVEDESRAWEAMQRAREGEDDGGRAEAPHEKKRG